MKRLYYLLLPLLLLSCKDDLETINVPEGELELTQVNAIIATAGNDTQTRADGDVVYLEDHISRFRFVDADRMTFTTFKRTTSPIGRFNYSDIEFLNNASGAWDRDKTTGSDQEPSNAGTHPARIYWSDATSEHTFIGFSLPNVKALLNDDSADFDWVKTGGVYEGSIGKPGETTMINYNPSSPETDEIKVMVDGAEQPKDIPASSLMRAEDLLLAYDTEVVAEASVAKVKFYHGLSSIKVKVMLSDFYGSELDGYTLVDSVIVKNQPTLYKWTQTSYKAEARSITHAENNPRDMFLWDYVPGGVGENAGKTFTFYGITVPQEGRYEFQNLQLSFRVRYPDPLKTDLAALKAEGKQPEHWLSKVYSATIPNSNPVKFHPNQCTIINIKLNHRDETMTIGAQYTDWEFVPTPDEGSLKKNSTFLQSAPAFNARPTVNRVTVATDPEATEDDATWLYYKKENDTFVTDANGKRILLDIYGNTGTADKPYTISTANQLLSFAYEVTNGGELGTGNNFEGKYIKLDAGIIMQKDVDSETVSWIGIGDSSHPFQGTFLGAERKITLLKGAPLFNYVGAKALIDKVVVENCLTLTGTAALAGTNAGVICACRVNGDVVSANSGSIGSLVGSNSGTVFACHHTGAVNGSGTVAGLVGSNSGSILFSYHAGELSGATLYGVASGSGTITCSYYDSKLAPAVTAVTGATGKETGEMQKEEFLNDPTDGWNTQISAWLAGDGSTNTNHDHFNKHRYQYQPAAYPKIQ